jgi:molybdopterin converting factor small subunit
MRISVRLKGSLAERFPDGRTDVQVPDGALVGGLVGALNLPPASYLFVVNGSMADRNARLADGNNVQIHPPMAGGR